MTSSSDFAGAVTGLGNRRIINKGGEIEQGREKQRGG